MTEFGKSTCQAICFLSLGFCTLSISKHVPHSVAEPCQSKLLQHAHTQVSRHLENTRGVVNTECRTFTPQRDVHCDSSSIFRGVGALCCKYWELPFHLDSGCCSSNAPCRGGAVFLLPDLQMTHAKFMFLFGTGTSHYWFDADLFYISISAHILKWHGLGSHIGQRILVGAFWFEACI